MPRLHKKELCDMMITTVKVKGKGCFTMKNDLTASLCYQGEKRFFTPGCHLLPQGLSVTLEHRPVTESADFLLLRLKNVGEQNTLRISNIKTLDLSVACAGKPVYHGLKGDHCGARSFTPLDFEITRHYHEEPTGGRSSDTTGFPYFDLAYDGGALAFCIGWTGQWSKDVFVYEDHFSVQIGLCYGDFYLRPGEEVRLPSVLAVRSKTARAARTALKNTVREYFSPKRYLGERMFVPIAIQCFDRYFQDLSGKNETNAFWNSEEGQKRTVDAARRIGGINTLWLDAAWFEGGFPKGVGNFCFAKGFPNGLGPVSEYAHANGMKFVLWFEPERVHSGTELAGRKEFLLQRDMEDSNFLLNLGNGEARAWLKQKLITMIRENGVDVYRQDFNIWPLPYWLDADEEGRTGLTEIKYIAGLYDLWDSLLAEFPHLVIDNCASGGRRLDLETAMRSVTLWRSDTGCFPETEKNRVITWNHNQILTLSEYLPYHACAIWEPDAYTVRSTATHGLACNFDIFSEEFDFALAEKSLAEVRETARFWDGDFYPLTAPTNDESVWTAYQLALPEEGLLYVFRRQESECSEAAFALQGIDAGAAYRLTFIDEHFTRTEREASGAELMQGLAVFIAQKRASCLVKYCLK